MHPDRRTVRRGSVEDRDVELIVPAPFPLGASPGAPGVPAVAGPGRSAAGSAPGVSVVGGSVVGGVGARRSVAGGSTERPAATGASEVLTAGAVTATAAALALRANRVGAAEG